MATKIAERLIYNELLSLNKITVIYSNDKIIIEYWLYDKAQKRNLAVHVETEREAFIDAIKYYQGRTGQLNGRMIIFSM